MQSLKTKLLLSVFLISSLEAYDKSFFPFLSYTSYSDSFKSREISGGAYASKKSQSNFYRFGFEYKDIEYENIQKKYQVDLIASFERKIAYNTKIYATLNLILSDLYQSDKNQVYFFGFNYNYDKIYLGLDSAFSIYNYKSLADGVLELNPYIYYWFDALNFGVIKTEFRYYYTSVSSQNVDDLSKTNNFYKFNILQNVGNFVNTISFGFGDCINLVEDKAFTVYNNNEIQKKSLTASVGYNFNKKTSMQLMYVQRDFDEYDPLLENFLKSAKSTSYILSANFNF